VVYRQYQSGKVLDNRSYAREQFVKACDIGKDGG
jgi:hypothetical protein